MRKLEENSQFCACFCSSLSMPFGGGLPIQFYDMLLMHKQFRRPSTLVVATPMLQKGTRDCLQRGGVATI